MAITPIGPRLASPIPLKPPAGQIEPPAARGAPASGPAAAANAFSALMRDAVGSIDKLQKTADGNVAKLATGQPVDLHDVTISLEQANLSFQLGLQVRNKMIEAYQEVMRMQV